MDKVASKTTDFQKAKAIFDIMHDKMGTSETSTWDIMVSSVRMLGNEVYGLLQKLETTHRSAHIKAPWTMTAPSSLFYIQKTAFCLIRVMDMA